ncbi:hypothetical protein M378DRAFT_867070 [Amanita muscaria Koide BX008]|uniref:Uncharacterized protein n=1 Tax=Amanita muscaria (strain Koide BX008) TaxID=946122 RepID=A0A0C2T3Q6_AMAMK|nr:hypothetical protein M378DRAFT_867070 [Amanita muscaria Koide BX008]
MVRSSFVSVSERARSKHCMPGLVACARPYWGVRGYSETGNVNERRSVNLVNNDAAGFVRCR